MVPWVCFLTGLIPVWSTVAWVYFSCLQPEFRSGLKPGFCLCPRLEFGPCSLHDFRSNSESNFVLNPCLVPARIALLLCCLCQAGAPFLQLEPMPCSGGRTPQEQARLQGVWPHPIRKFETEETYTVPWLLVLPVSGGEFFLLTSVFAAVLLYLFLLYSFLGIGG